MREHNIEHPQTRCFALLELVSMAIVPVNRLRVGFEPETLQSQVKRNTTAPDSHGSEMYSPKFLIF